MMSLRTTHAVGYPDPQSDSRDGAPSNELGQSESVADCGSFHSGATRRLWPGCVRRPIATSPRQVWGRAADRCSCARQTSGDPALADIDPKATPRSLTLTGPDASKPIFTEVAISERQVACDRSELTFGDGETVLRPAEAMGDVANGRGSALADLSGDGVAVLEQRLELRGTAARVGASAGHFATDRNPMVSSVRADSVAEAIREVSAEVRMPRFRHWDPVTSEKNPGDLVTVADQPPSKR